MGSEYLPCFNIRSIPRDFAETLNPLTITAPPDVDSSRRWQCVTAIVFRGEDCDGENQTRFLSTGRSRFADDVTSDDVNDREDYTAITIIWQMILIRSGYIFGDGDWELDGVWG